MEQTVKAPVNAFKPWSGMGLSLQSPAQSTMVCGAACCSYPAESSEVGLRATPGPKHVAPLPPTLKPQLTHG